MVAKFVYAIVVLDASRILANIGALGQQFAAAAAADGDAFNPKRGEYLASLGTSGLADSAALALNIKSTLDNFLTRQKWGFGFTNVYKYGNGEVTQSYGNREVAQRYWKDQAPKGPSIILTALTIVEGLELFAGFGPPAEGDKLKDGSQLFTTLGGQLKSALPDASWQGPAAQAYTDQTTALQNIAQTLAELDARLAALVKDQADWVTHMRLGFGILKDLLIAAYFIESVIRALTTSLLWGPALEVIFASLVCVSAIAVAMGFLTTLGICSIVNAQKADALTNQYTENAAAAIQNGTQLTPTGTAEAVASIVSSFQDTSASMLRTSAPADLATPAGVTSGASGSGEHSTLSAAASADETPEDGSPEILPTPQTPDATTPSFTMPTLAQLTALWGQATKPSAAAAPHTNAVNQMMEQIQQLAQKAQQGREAEAAPEEAALAGASAERAPIEAAAVGPEGMPEPRPADRIP